jgi:hypothetical protein
MLLVVLGTLACIGCAFSATGSDGVACNLESETSGYGIGYFTTGFS